MKKLFLFLVVVFLTAMMIIPLGAQATPKAATAEAVAESAPLPDTVRIVLITLAFSALEFLFLVAFAFTWVMIPARLKPRLKVEGVKDEKQPLWKRILGKIKWGLSQLLPLTYRSHYEEEGKKHFTVWRMWFGWCFDVDDMIEAA